MSNISLQRYEVACEILGVLISNHSRKINEFLASGPPDANSIEQERQNQALLRTTRDNLDPSDILAIEKTIALYCHKARLICGHH